MTSIYESEIDYQSLEIELDDAIRADALYQLQNDAKFRAIEQRVPTYDHFREMVNAAHLKPLERSDLQPKFGVQWNSVSTVSRCNRLSKNQNPRGILERFDLDANDIPRNADEFLRVWKNIADAGRKFQYLSTIKPAGLRQIFRPEIPFALLGEILEVCSKNSKEDAVVDILSEISLCERFELSVDFMSRAEKDIAKELLRSLIDRREIDDVANANKFQILLERYKILKD